MRLKLLRAKAGLNIYDPITEPTIILSTAVNHPWDAVIIPRHPNYSAIKAEASVIVVGCRIQGGQLRRAGVLKPFGLNLVIAIRIGHRQIRPISNA